MSVYETGGSPDGEERDIITIEGTIALGSGNSPVFDATVGSIQALDGLTATYNGRLYEIRISLQVVADVTKADWVVMTSDSFSQSSAAVGRSGSKYPIKIGEARGSYKGPRFWSGAHEFFHTLGLWHQPNSTHAITSYAFDAQGSDYRRPSGFELWGLYNAYRN